MTDHDDLVAKYSTPLEKMDPEARRRSERWDQHLVELRADGDIASEEQFDRQNYPIGLDDNYEPYPVTPQHEANEAGNRPSGDDHD